MDKRIKLAAIQFAETGPSSEAGEVEQKAVAGRKTLERARFFLRQAALYGVGDVEGAEHNFNAAIVFGRSVTFHLQSQYRDRPDFDYWYAWQENAMRDDKLLSFFVETRNIILKEGPVSTPVVNKTVKVIGSLPIGWLELPPPRSELWYRRGLRVLSLDAWRAMTLPLARLRLRWALLWQVYRASRLPISVTTQDLHFADLQYGDQRALELVRAYLDTLERVVKVAEEELGRDPTETGFPQLRRPPNRRCGAGKR
jgi:hypothetical protein